VGPTLVMNMVGGGCVWQLRYALDRAPTNSYTSWTGWIKRNRLSNNRFGAEPFV
jgi:hypothetical protein